MGIAKLNDYVAGVYGEESTGCSYNMATQGGVSVYDLV